MIFDKLVQRLTNAKAYKPSKSDFQKAVRSTCPCCGGSSLKLNVSEKNDGAILIHCFGGCEVSDIVGSIGFELSDLFPNDLNTTSPKHQSSHYKVRGWDWLSLTSALDELHNELIKIYTWQPIHSDIDDVLLSMWQSAQKVKALAEKYKYGKGTNL